MTSFEIYASKVRLKTFYSYNSYVHLSHTYDHRDLRGTYIIFVGNFFFFSHVVVGYELSIIK